MKKTILFLFCLILLSSFVCAVSPFLYPQVGGQYDVIYPQIDILKQNQDFNFDFHVINWTGEPINSSIECTLHLYNDTGNQIYSSTNGTPSDLYDYEFDVLGSNFSYEGSYSFLANCYNDTLNLGGFASFGFEVTADGTEPTPIADAYNMIGYIIGLGLIALILLVIGLIAFIKFREGGKD